MNTTTQATSVESPATATPLSKLPPPYPLELASAVTWLSDTFPSCAQYFANSLDTQEILDLKKVAELAPDPCWFIEHRVLPAGRWEMLIREEVFYGDREQARKVARELSESFYGEVRTQIWRRKFTPGIMVPKYKPRTGKRAGVDYDALGKRCDSMIENNQSVAEIIAATGLTRMTVENRRKRIRDRKQLQVQEQRQLLSEHRARLVAEQAEQAEQADYPPAPAQLVSHNSGVKVEVDAKVEAEVPGLKFGFPEYKDLQMGSDRIPELTFPLSRGRVNPILVSMIDRLPPDGAIWPQTDRDKWIAAMDKIFDMVYRDRDSDREEE